MGYNLYIITSDHWLKGKGKKIPQSAWRKVVAEDPELEFLGELAPNNPLAAQWLGHPRRPYFWFDVDAGELDEEELDEEEWEDEEKEFKDERLEDEDEVQVQMDGGQVMAKSPDHRTVNKMIEIARQLGARVQGEEGEFYDEFVEVPVTLRERIGNWWKRG